MTARTSARPDVFEALYLTEAEATGLTFPWRVLYGLTALAVALTAAHFA